MNKKWNFILFIAFFAAAVVFAFYAGGYQSSYLNNYIKNFKTNLYLLTNTVPLPEQITAAVPTPNIEEILNTPEPTLTPAPIFDAQRRNEIYAINKSVMIPLQNSANMKFEVCGDYLVAADKTVINFLSRHGKVEAAADVQLSNPLLKVADNYILAADKGGTKAYMFENTQMLFDIDTDGAIVCADVSDNGDIILVCEKNQYKGCVTVYNKNGEPIYIWNSGSDRILDADISGSRRTAVLTMNLDNNTITSNVLWCDINKVTPDVAAQYANTLMYDIEFSGNDLFVVGVDRLASVAGGKAQWEVPFENNTLKKYLCRKNFVGTFDKGNLPYIEAYNASGKNKASLKINAHPDYIDFSDDTIAYNEDRLLIVSDLSGKKTKTFSCQRDIKDIIIINQTTVAVIYSSSIEFVNVKR